MPAQATLGMTAIMSGARSMLSFVEPRMPKGGCEVEVHRRMDPDNINK